MATDVAIFLSENHHDNISPIKRSPRSLSLPRDDAVQTWTAVHPIGD